MNNQQVIGIDLGGTHVRAGVISEGQITKRVSDRIPASGNVEDVLTILYEQIDKIMNPSVKAIGVGVPSVVDIEMGIVYDVQNIPSWKEVHLKDLLEARYHLPALINNDANCYALGEKYFGKGRQSHSMIGLSIGTGLGAGIIINDKLYAGINCGAGEFGEVNYLDHNYEYYASGQFFQNFYKTTGKDVFEKALKNEDIKIIDDINFEYYDCWYWLRRFGYGNYFGRIRKHRLLCGHRCRKSRTHEARSCSNL